VSSLEWGSDLVVGKPRESSQTHTHTHTHTHANKTVSPADTALVEYKIECRKYNSTI